MTDPDLISLQKILHACVDDCIGYLRQAYSGKEKGFNETNFKSSSFPHQSENTEHIYLSLKNLIISNPQFLNTHPGFMGWSLGAGNGINLIADLVQSTVNASVQTPAQTLSLIEQELISWVKTAMGWSATASGIACSGSSVGNLLALMAARYFHSPESKTLGNTKLKRTKVFGSAQTHLTIRRALNVMGLGESSFISFSTKPDGTIDTEKLEEFLKNCSESDKPFCLTANLGTTECGAFDDLKTLRKICDAHHIWLHLDGAWGAWLTLDKKRKAMTEGIELGDSLTLDFHKWPGASIGTGLVLVKEKVNLTSVFSTANNYLESLSGNDPAFGSMGIELSRSAKALSAWLLIKFLGFEQIGKMVSECCDKASQIELYLSGVKKIEWAYKVTSNTLVFRYKSDNEPESENDLTNRKIAQELWRQGKYMPSLVEIKKKTYLRFCLINHRLTNENVLELIDILKNRA